MDIQPKQANSQVIDVNPEDVQRDRDHYSVIDVRRPEEFSGELGHIPGARLLTLNPETNYLQEIPKDKTVVFVCRSGGRSVQAASQAIQQGCENVRNMKGGMLRWNELKLGVDHGNV